MQLYRKVFALPGVRTLLVLIFFARIPSTAAGMVLTLHVAVTLGRGYGAAGLQSSAFTLGSAAGAPLVGFVVDHASPAWGFAVAGIGGVLVAGLAAVLATRQRQTAPPEPVPSVDSAA